MWKPHSVCILMIYFVGVYGNSENTTNTIQNITNSKISGKTYFLQFRKTSDSESPDTSKYVRINHYGHDNEFLQRKDQLIKRYEDMFGKLIDGPENLKEIEQQEKGFKISDNYIDEEWSHSINHTNYDLPNITHEIYDAMLENNKHNTIKNASMVKFFFEIDTNLTSNNIRFNTDSLHELSEKLIDAELHVYRLPRDTKNNATKSNATENVVRLYQRMDDNNNKVKNNSTNTTQSNPDLHKLAHVIYISSHYAGWQVFKVKNVIENWKKGEENLGFLISTTDAMENEFKVDFAHRERNGGKYQPTLVVYLDRDDTGHKKSTRKNKQKKHPRRLNMSSKMLSKDFTPCSRQIWYISFHELGWNNFIIAPNGYMAYKCQGSCKSPLNINYSNHGKLLNIFQSAGSSTQPCCVANNYKNLIIMYYDKESNVVIKEYEDMVVNSCGCR